ncbi:hypothetical protein RJ639_028503, partial [Escallonia herrerae]
MVVRLAAVGQLAVDGRLDLGVVGDQQCKAIEERRGGADGHLVAIHERRLSVGSDFDECVPRPREVCITNMSFMAKISQHMHLIAMMETCALCLILRIYVSQGRNLLTGFMYIGHLKDMSLKDQMAKDPIEDIPKAVLRTLRRNKLRD